MLLTRAQQQAAAAGPAYDPAAVALFVRMTTAPDATRKGVINTLIVALKAAGVWVKLDCLYLLAAADAQAARLNWIAAANNLSAIAAPTFTADRGYTGDGAASYLDSGFIVPGGQFAQNNAHLGLWTRVAAPIVAGIYEIGSSNARINVQATATTIQVAVNSAVGNPVVAAGAFIGHTCAVRNNSANFDSYRNGVANVTTVSVSAILALPMYILARAGAGPAPSSFSTRQVSAAHWGAALSAAEVLALKNALQIYMTAVGA